MASEFVYAGDCFNEIGLYDESITLGQDTEFLFRLAEKYNFETIPEVLVKIHKHEAIQLTDKGNSLLRLELRQRILQKHSGLLSEYPKLYYIHYKVIAELSYSLKLKLTGRKTMYSIIKNSPFNIRAYADLLSFELTGADATNFYNISGIKKFVTFFREKRN